MLPVPDLSGLHSQGLEAATIQESLEGGQVHFQDLVEHV